MKSAATRVEQLDQGLAEMALELPAAARERLLAYLALLYKWNKTYQLTALREQDEAVSHHLLDSLAILPYVPEGAVLDVGSGGGLPGIPLAIARPQTRVVLLDSNSKKAAFLHQARIELGLDEVFVHAGRVEQYHPGKEAETGFATIVARAFAKLADFTGLSGHLLAPGGCWLAMKGVRPADEIANLPATIRVEAVHRLRVPGVMGERHLLLIRPKRMDTIAEA